MIKDCMKLVVPAIPVNESFTRSCVAAFCVRLNPTLEEIEDIKTAVSEAVTNCIVHAYEYGKGDIEIIVTAEKDCIGISISDRGRGIKDIDKAMQAFFTTDAVNERSGMGFTVMGAFTDELKVISKEGEGTTILMKKYMKRSKAE